MHTYVFWAWAYPNGDYKEWQKTIKRKNPISKDQEEKLMSAFTSNIMSKYKCSLGLWGCDKI